VDSIAIQLVRTHIREVGMPHVCSLLAQPYALRLDGVLERVEQAKLDTLSVFAEESEIHSAPIPGGSERIRLSGIDALRHVSLLLRFRDF
jgi:hypothetical protein